MPRGEIPCRRTSTDSGRRLKALPKDRRQWSGNRRHSNGTQGAGAGEQRQRLAIADSCLGDRALQFVDTGDSNFDKFVDIQCTLLGEEVFGEKAVLDFLAKSGGWKKCPEFAPAFRSMTYLFDQFSLRTVKRLYWLRITCDMCDLSPTPNHGPDRPNTDTRKPRWDQ